MSVIQPTESPFDHDRYFTFTVNGETYNGSIHFLTHYAEKPDFAMTAASDLVLAEFWLSGGQWGLSVDAGLPATHP